MFQNNPVRTFQLSLLMIVLIIILGSCGIYFIEKYVNNDPNAPQSYLDALYFAITTISTTGYGDITPHSPESKLFTIIFLVVGLIVMTWAGANVVAFIVEGHLSEAVRVRKMEKLIKSLSGHYIICGLGRVGREVLAQFRTYSIPFVVIDKSKEHLDDGLDEDELRVVGDTTQDEMLKLANVESAKGLISCCPSDVENVFTILTAKGLNPRLHVISRGSEERSRTKLMQAGADRVVMPSRLGGMRLAAMALRPTIVDFLDQTLAVSEDEQPLLLEEVAIEEGNPYIGMKLMDTYIKSKTDVMVMACKQANGKMVLNPASTFRIEKDTVLIGLGRESDFQKLRDLMGIHESSSS